MATKSCPHWLLWLWGLTQPTSPAPLQPGESTVTLSQLSPCPLQENRKSCDTEGLGIESKDFIISISEVTLPYSSEVLSHGATFYLCCINKPRLDFLVQHFRPFTK